MLDEKVDGNKPNIRLEANYSVINGLISRFPEFIGHDSTTNMYKFFQALDRVNYRFNEFLQIYTFLKTVNGETWSVAFGDYLTKVGINVGIKRILKEPDESYLNRIFNLSNYIINGATEDELRYSIYYFIGEDSFSSIDKIRIIPRTDTYAEIDFETTPNTPTYVFQTKGEEGTDNVGPAYDVPYYWANQFSFGLESYIIEVTLESGSSTDRTKYEYWALESPTDTFENLSLLYELIRGLTSISHIFTIDLKTP